MGAETIDVVVETEVDEIVLNAAEIEIISAQLTDGTTTIGASPRYDEEMQRVALSLESPATSGDWELHIEFAGIGSGSVTFRFNLNAGQFSGPC